MLLSSLTNRWASKPHPDLADVLAFVGTTSIQGVLFYLIIDSPSPGRVRTFRNIGIRFKRREHIIRKAADMGVFSILPEYLSLLESWLARTFVRLPHLNRANTA